MAIDSGAGLLLFIFIALVVSGIVVGTGSEGYGNVDSKALGIVYPNEILPNDLLPIDSVAAGISGLAPTADVNRNYLFPSDNLLSGVSISGLNTVSGHKRVPNLQDRIDPVIPKTIVSPWNNSSVERTWQQKDIWSMN